MFICPECKVQLDRTKGPAGIIWRCPSCKGRSATLSLLRKHIPRRIVNFMWQTVRGGSLPKKRRCPACNHMMTEAPAGDETLPYLDVCTVCQFVWLDTQEYEALPKLDKTPVQPKQLPQEARERLAILQLDDIREKARGSDWGEDGPASGWQWIPALLGMPVEQDVGSIRKMPWVTWGLTLIITVISVMAFDNLKDVVQIYGLIPAELGRYGGLTLLTSFFLHGGIFHLIGNMYFLLVFGDNVEERLGKLGFLCLLVCALLAGGIAHALGQWGSTTPCVGASGGISGVIVYYALSFPRARLGILVRIYLHFRWVRMPAYVMLLIWVGMQALGVYLQLAGFSNVSSLAHLGGAAVGFLFWLATNGMGGESNKRTERKKEK